MSLGASFSLSPDQVEQLLSCQDDDERTAWLENLEESIADEAWFQHDKAWDALHRCLADGRLEIPEDGPPLSHAVFGTQPVMEDPSWPVFAGLLPAEQVPGVVEALDAVDEAWLRERYDALDWTDYGHHLSDEDFQYTWENLSGLRWFLAQAAVERSSIVFTVVE